MNKSLNRSSPRRSDGQQKGRASSGSARKAAAVQKRPSVAPPVLEETDEIQPAPVRRPTRAAAKPIASNQGTRQAINNRPSTTTSRSPVVAPSASQRPGLQSTPHNTPDGDGAQGRTGQSGGSAAPNLSRRNVPVQQAGSGQANSVRLSHVISRATARMDGLDSDISVVVKEVSSVKGEMTGMKRSMTAMTSLLDTMNGKMSQMLETGMSSSTGSTMPGSKKERDVKPMLRYEKIMLERIRFREVAFDNYVLPRCTISSLFAEIADRCVTSHLDPAGLTSILESVFFSLKRTEKKEAYKTSGGKDASSLRRRIIHNVLLQARVDTFRRFRSNADKEVESDDYHSSGGLAAADTGRPLKPSWLQGCEGGGTNYITQAHANTAQEHQESSSLEKSSYQRRLAIAGGARPNRADDGEFVMSYLYSTLLLSLNHSRRSGPMEFFQRLGYLFVDWNPHKTCRVSKDDMKVSWIVDYEKALPCSIDDIPKAISVSAADRNAVEKNKEAYSKFVEEREEMQLMVTHDVLVRLKGKCGDVRNHIGVDARQWVRVVSLIDVAAHFFRSCCGFGRGGSFTDVLMYNSRSIIALYNTAWVFRLMLGTRTTPRILSPNLPGVFASTASDPASSPIADMSADIAHLFAILTPSASMVERALVRVTCAVPEETFNAEHIDANGSESDLGENRDQQKHGDKSMHNDVEDACGGGADDGPGDM